MNSEKRSKSKVLEKTLGAHKPGTERISGLSTLKNFPSDSLIMRLYTIGSLLGLGFAFDPSLSPARSLGCLLISWLFAFGALGLCVFLEYPSKRGREEN